MVSITMKTLLLAAFVCLAVANNADKECGENEFLNPCGGCQRSCAIPSPMCSLQCRPPQCECLPDYVRDDEGRCIPESYCPKPCGKNAHWATCSTCQGTCKNPNPFCTKECKPPKCMCDHGFVLNDQGECIPKDSCPTQAVVAVEDAPRCPANEQWVKCSGCDGTCNNQFPFCTRECKPPKCQCKPGFVRNSEGRCIHLSYCPKPCGKNAHWATCSTCQGTCENPHPSCTFECKPPKCMCNHGFVLNDQGECIPEESCPAQLVSEQIVSQPKCGKNEVWHEVEGGNCDSSCDGSCSNPFDPVCTQNCKPSRCMCASGFVRNGEKCIALNTCPGFQCPANEEWRKCSGCDGTCHRPFPVCTMDCKPPRCQCKHGFVRNDEGNCVTLATCTDDDRCGPNEVWREVEGGNCDSSCDGSCSNPFDPICTQNCKPSRCMCKQDYVRYLGHCVPLSSCPADIRFAQDASRCPVNEEWRTCSGCDGSCDLPNPVCTMECKPPRCQCKNGFVRNSQGKCVARNSCPKCGKNQVWRQCSGCEGSCKNPFPICTADCKPPRCQCQLGFVRDKNGECVAVESCPLA